LICAPVHERDDDFLQSHHSMLDKKSGSSEPLFFMSAAEWPEAIIAIAL